jgi:hypothetical protein
VEAGRDQALSYQAWGKEVSGSGSTGLSHRSSNGHNRVGVLEASLEVDRHQDIRDEGLRVCVCKGQKGQSQAGNCHH